MSAFLTIFPTALSEQFPSPNPETQHFDGLHHSNRTGCGLCTTVSYYPQLKKCWETGSAGDLSLKMFLTLATGVALWVVYGFLKSDVVIIIANAVSLALLSGLLYFKLRERQTPA